MKGVLSNRDGTRFWNFSTVIYRASANVIIDENCFGFMFTNVGDTPATVNGMLIFPSATPATAIGDSRSIAGHVMDLFKGNLQLAFIAPAGVAPAVEIVQISYATKFE